MMLCAVLDPLHERLELLLTLHQVDVLSSEVQALEEAPNHVSVAFQIALRDVTGRIIHYI